MAEQKAEYTITKKYQCPKCEGVGIIQNPIWAQYWEENPHGNNNTADEDLAWFRENYSYSIESWKDAPHEEIYCDECEGEKNITESIDLRDALVELGFVVGVNRETAR